MIPSMNRRSWIGLSSAALLGCQKRKAPTAAAPKSIPDAQEVHAGPFSVRVPEDWAKTAVIKQVPMHPLYTAEEWKQTRTEKDFVLKPGYHNRPLHWAIRLPAATPEGIEIHPDEADDDAVAAQILIHKADEWGSIMTDGSEGREKSAGMLAALRKQMEEATKGGDDLVSPAFMDAHLGFRIMKKRLDFYGGHGVRMLAQWMIEPNLMRKGELHYLFVGMSEDNTCQIIATFPLSLPGLPGDDHEAEHLGRSLKRYDELNQNSEAYEKDATEWLERHAAEITPRLDTLDEMLKSLVARRWE
jgi:hypothetical protein